MPITPQQILQQYWHHNHFRGLQQPIIEAVLQQQDVLALLPTGGGKSICFQVPALLQNGLCLVVSPLIALMKDQVYHLTQKKINAVAIYSGLSNKQVEDILFDASKGKYKFLYLSPERLQSALFKAYLPQLPLNLIAVDEAHCISQWGYDFRPPYLHIAQVREVFPNTPIIALTASATSIVQQDIIDKLQLKNVAQFQQSFARPNISYSVFKVDSKINKAVEILQAVQGCGIIYCKNRKLTSYVAQLLQLQGISATHYHAGLSQDERNEKQQQWINNKVRIIVCTNAFGMGIDKADVRTVIHYDVPDCIENYYQEAGRAGRDGKRAFAILLYHSTDVDALQLLPQQRYPAISVIKKIYQSLANYLQIPVGLGQGNYYDFDVIAFSRNFNLDIFLVLNVLKTLEHEEHIVVSDAVYIPPKIKFIVDKTTIEDFATLHPQLDDTMKALLRTYSGILDNYVNINEKYLAKMHKLSYEKIATSIQQLYHYKIIDYIAPKETPQIYFVNNRAEASSLYINQDQYFKRKQQYQNRVKAMLHYMSNEYDCRSQMIASYFNAPLEQDCESCDNCLRKKNIDLTQEEFEVIKNSILKTVSNNTSTAIEIMSQLQGIKKSKFWKVFHHLHDNQQITIDEFGNIKMM